MKYEEIINLPRPASSHPKMSALDRAAQFSSFEALVGLSEQIDETARQVSGRIELSEDDTEQLQRKLLLLAQKANADAEFPVIRAVYFVPDEHKDGGAYITKIGTVKRVDEVFRKIIFTDSSEISTEDILDFEIIIPNYK